MQFSGTAKKMVWTLQPVTLTPTATHKLGFSISSFHNSYQEIPCPKFCHPNLPFFSPSRVVLTFCWTDWM